MLLPAPVATAAPARRRLSVVEAERPLSGAELLPAALRAVEGELGRVISFGVLDPIRAPAAPAMITELLALHTANDERTAKALPMRMDALVHSRRLRQMRRARYHRSGSPLRWIPTRGGVIWGGFRPPATPTMGCPALDLAKPRRCASAEGIRRKHHARLVWPHRHGATSEVAGRSRWSDCEPVTSRAPWRVTRTGLAACTRRLRSPVSSHLAEGTVSRRREAVRFATDRRCANTTGSTSSPTRSGRSRGPSRSAT